MRLAALAVAAMLAAPATAQPVPPPAGATLLLELAADGVQIYACELREQRPAWVFKAPEAALFDAAGRQVGSHGAGPFWRMDDGSRITGAVTANAPAPRPGAIPWLLLRATADDAPGALRATAWVRRFDTVGGLATPDGCEAATIGRTLRMRYTATYGFFAQ
jgi:Protein of unknown function (DUF3455)